MEEIVKKIDELIKVVENNGVPAWLTWVGILVPIFISIAVIVQASVQAGNNKKFKKYISDRDVKVQMHNDFMKIYDDFCYAQNIICVNNIEEIFAIPELTSMWYNDLNKALTALCQSGNRAQLLIPSEDKDLRKVVEDTCKRIEEIKSMIDKYLYTGQAEFYRGQTWNKISGRLFGIQYGDYRALSMQKALYDDFIKLYSNDELNDIKKKVEELRPLFKYENFDKCFEKYVRIELSEEKKND